MWKILFGFLVAMPSAWGWEPEAAVVKVQSRDCLSSNPFLGSGLLLTSGSRVLVLTSDHVVQHSNNPSFCHSVRVPGDGDVKAEFLSAEWGNGLALLELPGLVPKGDWPTLSQIQEAKLGVGQSTLVMGYPSQSDHLFKDSRAVIADPAHPSLLFGLQPFLVRLEQAHGEFGMSGGPAFFKDQFVGVLSHQILASGQNQLLLIPGSVALQWVRGQVAQGREPKTFFYQKPSSQGSVLGSVESGDFLFDWSCDGFQPNYCFVHLQRFGSHYSVEYQDPRGWIARFLHFFHTATKPSRAGQVRFFRRGARATLDPLIPVTSKQQFIQWLHDPSLEPIFTSFHQIFYRSHVVELQPLGEKLEKALGAVPADPAFASLVEELRVVGKLLSTIPPDYKGGDDRWMMVQYRDIRRLRSASASWNALFKQHFTASRDAWTLLQEIEKYLGQVNLVIARNGTTGPDGV